MFRERIQVAGVELSEPGFSTHPEGTGQGLALLDEVVRNDHRGTFEVQESPLGGARFVLSLPPVAGGRHKAVEAA